MMTRRLVLLLLALGPIMIANQVGCQPTAAQSVYVSVTLCEIAFHHEKVNPKYISVDAEYLSAVPHGLFLTDKRCARKALQIDFADNGLDPSVALLKDHLSEIHRAIGTFRGILKRDPNTKRLFLWLQSVVNFQSADYIPDLHKDEPIRVPDSPPAKWPPS
jgi:hypothetical protein